MGEPQFNPDDKPAFNTFDLPTICNTEDAERPCCDPCTDWIFCLSRSLYELTLDGFEFEDWLAGHWLSNLSQYKADQPPQKFSDNGAGETFAFEGVYLAEPPLHGAIASPCPFPEREDACTHTHRIRHERTIFTNSPEGAEVKRFGLNVNTECVVVEEVKYLKFTVNLVWQGADADAVYEPAYDPQGGDPLASIYCPPKEETPYEPTAEKYWSCCPILISDLIPLASITSLADLADVTLHPLPPATATFDPFYGVFVYDTGDSQLCLQAANTWVCCVGVLLVQCIGGVPHCVYFPVNECETTIDDSPANLDPFQDPPTAGEIQGCTNNVYNGGCDAPASVTCTPSFCVSEPIEYVTEGTYKLKVIDGKCRLPENCGSCIPDIENPHRRLAIKYGDVRFTWNAGASCSKTLTPIAPDCLTIVKVYWSTGDVTEGLDPLFYTLRNLDPLDVLRYSETISAIFVDDRGCIYCWTEELSCGCCEGVSGSIAITQVAECVYRLTGSLTAPEGCPNAFIEYQIISPDSDCATDFVDCDCTDLDPLGGEDSCLPCSGTLVDGGHRNVTVDGTGWYLRYRVWDDYCGCVSDWVVIPLYCANCFCCNGRIVAIRITTSGITNGEDCVACDGFNRVWTLAPYLSDCVWREVGPEILCIPGDPFSGVPSEIFYSIGCSEQGYGSPAIEELVGTAGLTAGGSATWQKVIVDAGAEADCEALSGAHTLIDSADANCVLGGASAVVEIIVAA